jgi:DNA-binding Xre family transcriptional regulator
MVSAAQHLHYSPGQIVRSEEAELDTDERRARAEARRQKAAEMGTRLRILRAVRGYSQRRLSELTGLSRQYLSELEQGKRPRPRRETLEGLAAALEVTGAERKGAVPLGGRRPRGTNSRPRRPRRTGRSP